MSSLDALGHLLYCSIAIGMFLIARKVVWGWAFRFVGEIGWVFIGIELGMTSIWIWGLVFAVLDTVGFCTWMRSENLA